MLTHQNEGQKVGPNILYLDWHKQNLMKLKPQTSPTIT